MRLEQTTNRAHKRAPKMLVMVGTFALLAGGAYYASVGKTSQEPTAQEVQQSGAVRPASQTSSRPPASNGLATIAVQVTQPRRQNIERTTRLPGNIAPLYQTTLYAKVSGYLKWIGFDKGDEVKEGTVLAIIDAPEVREQYEQAKADYAIKKLTFERLSRVWKENPDVIAKQDVDVAEAAYIGAKHVLEQRAAMLDYTKVRAPFSGTITARFVDPGAMIQVATNSETQASPLFTIMDISKVRVYFNVPQEDAALAKPGREVAVTLRQQPGHAFKGTIARTTGALDPATRTMLAEANLPNPDRLLQPGSFAEVEVSLVQHPNAIVIPPAALLIDNSGQAVFIVENGHAKKVSIETGIDDGMGIEVTKGLKGTEQIVAVGQSQLTEGVPVTTAAYSLPDGKLASQQY